MRKTFTVLALAATFPAGAAFADDDCFVPLADWQPRGAVAQLAKDNGWTVRRIKTDDGCYEVKGKDANGREFKAKIDPATLRVIKLKYKDHDKDRSRHGSDDGALIIAPDMSGAGSPVAPPNALFGTGAPPRVEVK